MTLFEQILLAADEDLLKLIYRAAASRARGADAQRSREIARALGLANGQLICAVGFHPSIRQLPDVISMLGADSYDTLAHQRDRYFTHDVYERLTVKNVLAIYANAKRSPWLEQHLQTLLQKRLRRVEDKIEAQVNPLVIERYKKEIRALYGSGLAWPDFVETRLREVHTGFRTLLGEVQMIIENRIIPLGDIFFRNSILPEEKRRLIKHGLVPREVVRSRLESADLSALERRVLEEELRLL
ncbi:MAG: hypothetical protein QE509_12855 [Gammaproteobacteria bacterium]|jgi:hypothetical protein|nr:hypothetical protein [Gammaproteobacteria bacterium]